MFSIQGCDLDVKKITFNPNITRIANGSKHMGLGVKNKKVILQTPFMSCPFGLSKNKYDNDKFSVDLSFNKKNKDEYSFYKNLLKLDKMIVEEMLSRSEILFPNNLSENVIKNNHNPIVKKSSNYDPRMRIKIPYESNKFNCEIIDTNSNNITNLEDNLAKGSIIRCTIECGGIWIVNNNYSCIWKMKRIEIKDSGIKKQQDEFIDDSDSD